MAESQKRMKSKVFAAFIAEYLLDDDEDDNYISDLQIRNANDVSILSSVIGSFVREDGQPVMSDNVRSRWF